MSDNIRVGLIGYGYASKTFHAPLIAGTPGLELAVISSSDETKVKADWPTVTVVSEPKHLFNDPNIDLIVIPTPNDTHFPLAKAALEAGKHVVVDKPFTVTLSQARELDALAKSLGRVLSVFHNRRWDSDFLTGGPEKYPDHHVICDPDRHCPWSADCDCQCDSRQNR